jgi:hypothetical protein
MCDVEHILGFFHRMAVPYRHELECDKRLLFYPLSKFPIECDNSQDPVSYDELTPHVSRNSIVYEFTPNGGTLCWDAASLYMTLEAMRHAQGEDVYRHPIHNCIISLKNVQVIFLTARLSSKALQAALKRMLRRLTNVGLAGAEIVVACMSFYKMCMDPTYLIGPLESILGPGTAYHSLLDAEIGVVIYDGVKRFAQAWEGLQLGRNEWKDWK